MITEAMSDVNATYTHHYQVTEGDNEVYLVLDSVKYCCGICEAKAMVDLSLVPAHNIALVCVSCDNTLCTIPKEHFKIRLVPEVSL